MRRESREKVEVVFSTKTKANTSSRRESHLQSSTESAQQDANDHIQPSGEVEDRVDQTSREQSEEIKHIQEIKTHGESSIRKKSRRSSRKTSESKGVCHVSASVRRLRPSKALLQKETSSVADCVKAMVESRTEATLVTDANGTLTGILTDKDIALRVVARGLDPISTTALQVMTPNPSCVSPRACAIEALEQMVSGQFRHLPVADNGNVVGILDIAKCLYDAISKIEGAYAASTSQFNETMLKLDGSIGDTEASLFEKMRETLFLPTLSSLIHAVTDVPEITDTANARDASMLMYETNSSAVMVYSECGTLQGILTTKDLMRRVLAVGRDPDTCLVGEIMTANPDCAALNTTILDALHTMHDGKFLHLPVLNEDGIVVGLADVLQVTCGVVHHMGSFQQQHTAANVNPVWNQFWNSMLNAPMPPQIHASSASQSASTTSPSHETTHLSRIDVSSSYPSLSLTDTFAFKLTDHKQDLHRFTSSSTDLPELIRQVRDRSGLGTDEEINLYFVDDEGDTILLFAEKDLEDAVRLASLHDAPYLKLKSQIVAKTTSEKCEVLDEDLSELLERLPSQERQRSGSRLTESTILKLKHGGLVTALTVTFVGAAAMLYAKKK